MPCTTRYFTIAMARAFVKRPLVVTVHGNADVYELPPGTPYGFDRSFDQRMGYRSKSMLVAPMFVRPGRGVRNWAPRPRRVRD